MSVPGPGDALAGAPGAADAEVPGLGAAAGDEVGREHAAHQDSQVSGTPGQRLSQCK